MRLQAYIQEAKKMGNTMIGFSVNRSKFSRISKYIRSWLVKHDIEYKKVEEPHFTIAQITGTYPKDELIREIHSIDKNITFKPKGIRLFQGKNVNRDFLVLEYKVNAEFLNIFNEISQKYEIRYFSSIKPHISLITLEPGVMTNDLLKEIEFAMPPIPNIKPDNTALWNKSFKVEYKEG